MERPCDKLIWLLTAQLGAHLLPAAAAGAPPSGAAFLKLDPSARSYALGRAHSVSSLGAQALSGNPALLGRMPNRFEFFSAYASLMGGAQYGHLAAAFGRRPGGWLPLEAVGLSVTQVRIGGLEGRDASGNATGSSFSAQDMVLALGSSARLSRRLSLGGTVKAFRSTIAGYASNLALAGDAGLSYRHGSARLPFALGLSVRNFGQGLRFISQQDPLPASLNAGASMALRPATLFVEVSRPLGDGRASAGAGMEFGLGAVALRGGYRLEGGDHGNLALRNQEGLGRLLGGLSTGIGIKVGGARLDYALGQPAVEFGLSHRISLSVKWGALREAEPDPRRGSLLWQRRSWDYSSNERDIFMLDD